MYTVVSGDGVNAAVAAAAVVIVSLLHVLLVAFQEEKRTKAWSYSNYNLQVFI